MSDLTAKEVAAKFDTDARTLRKFLRSDEQVQSVGKGHRYAIDSRKVNALHKRFIAWSEARSKSTEEQ